MRMRMQRFSGWIHPVLPQTTILMVVATMMIGAATAAQTNIYYVDIANAGNDSPPYMTWATAATNIQDAVDQAEADIDIDDGIYCEVIVAPGTYVMIEQLTLTEPVRVRSQSGDPETTTISGGYPASSNRVIHVTGEAWISGFTVSNGYASGYAPDNYGGGVFMTTNAAGKGGWLTDCHVVHNQARRGPDNENAHGAGIYLHYGGTASNCLVKGNFSNNAHGAGIATHYGGTILNCEIVENAASSTVHSHGGGLYMNYGGFMSNSLVARNTARWPHGVFLSYGGEIVDSVITDHRGQGLRTNNGGLVRDSVISDNDSTGVYLNRGGTLRNCIVEHNRARGIGSTASALAENVIVRYNSIDGNGGGIHADTRTTFHNILVYGNTATGYGGGISAGTFENLTVVQNNAAYGGGIGVPDGGTVNAVNMIVVDNQATVESNNVYNVSSLTYSLTQPLIPGEGNIADDPIFRKSGSGYGEDAVAGNYRLRGHSPCIGTGLNQTWMDDAVDVEGNPRLIASRPWIDPIPRVDMGAYETPRIYRGSVIELR